MFNPAYSAIFSFSPILTSLLDQTPLPPQFSKLLELTIQRIAHRFLARIASKYNSNVAYNNKFIEIQKTC